MRTTLRKRNFSSSNPRNTSPRHWKKRKLTPITANDHNSNLSLSQTELQSLHNQLLAIKNKHVPNKSSNTQTNNSNAITKNPISKPIQNTNTNSTHTKTSQKHTNNTKSATKSKINNQKHNKTYGPPISKPKTKNVVIKPIKSDIKNNKPNRKPKSKKIPIKSIPKINNNKKNVSIKPNPSDITNKKNKSHKQNNKIANTNAIPPEIKPTKNENVSINSMPPKTSDDWDNFINSTDFSKVKTKSNTTDNQSKTDANSKTDLISKATATESEWLDFLDTRYDKTTNERDSNWKPPNIKTFWDQGPIGLVQNWWNDSNYEAYVGNENRTLYEQKQINKRNIINNTNKQQKQQKKLIKMDIMKELKQQKLEKRLRDRIEKGELVKNITQSDNAFESFFTSALDLGNDIKNGLLTKEEKIEERKQRKTKIIKPKMRAIKQIATFENDDLFFFEDSGSDSGGDVTGEINENDMIYINENSVGKKLENVSGSESAIIASKIRSENVLLEQRVKMQHNEMVNGSVVKGHVKNNGNGVVSANILSDTVEDSMKEKRILKKLNVMDYVSNYKNAFFREVKELNLNADVLVDNWNVVKKHEGLSRKLRKKLGIVMARERVKRMKKCKMQKIIDEMVNESESDESVSDETITDDTDEELLSDNDMIDVCEFIEA